jgi:hypothetical protein
VEEKPPVWVGHVGRNEHVAVLEMRGGTHLILLPGTVTPGAAPFDLMVDDLDATHADWGRAIWHRRRSCEGRSTTCSRCPTSMVTS